MYLLEKGRISYGVGNKKPACLLLDRFPVVSKGVKKNQEYFDFSVIPNVIALLKNIVETVQTNYPEVFSNIYVTPASWFFVSCFKLTSYVFEKKYRDRFQMIEQKNVYEFLSEKFSKGLHIRIYILYITIYFTKIIKILI